MKKLLILKFLFLFFHFSYSQGKPIIETTDIDNFWAAFDKLKSATTQIDSIEIIQSDYIDHSTNYFKEFIKLRNFKAQEYVSLIRKYPKFWKSIRKETEKVKYKINEIQEIFVLYEKALPNFKRPNICFAIGCLRTGGTIAENMILIGTELAASTAETDASELSPWLKSVVGTFENIGAVISHESIHTQQKNRLKTLAEFALNEGVADFLMS